MTNLENIAKGLNMFRKHNSEMIKYFTFQIGGQEFKSFCKNFSQFLRRRGGGGGGGGGGGEGGVVCICPS